MIYCDAASAMAPLPESVAFYASALQEDFCNQEARHAGALRVRQKLHEAEKQLALALLGTPEYGVVWGTSATELFQLFAAFTAGKRITTTPLEHPALLAALRNGNPAYLACGRDGRLRPGSAGEVLAVHQVQSELGVMQDLRALREGAPEALLFVDSVQAAGKMPLPPGGDVYVISGVKFGAPGGAALLFGKEGPAAALGAFAGRFRHEEYRMGRTSIPLALTLLHTVRLREARQQADRERQTLFAARLRAGLARIGLVPTIPEKFASPYIQHFLLPGKQSAVVVRMLSERGIFAASGSACASESVSGSPALRALGYRGQETFSGLRLSFGFGAAPEEADFLAENLADLLKKY